MNFTPPYVLGDTYPVSYTRGSDGRTWCSGIEGPGFIAWTRAPEAARACA